ncbi:MAG: phosphoribosyltransferase [Planctomycetes bacterium]|nr:phosphoribosyltransferase [Planctomycetota bacterium]
MIFQDRSDAGRQLAEQLTHLRDADPVVLALPRGGVVVAWPVAQKLAAPLDVLIVRKLGAPGQPEFGFGATTGDVRVLDEDSIRILGLTAKQIDLVTAVESQEAQRRQRVYRGDRNPVKVQGRTAIVVDDGLATGVTAKAAIRALRHDEPARIVLAIPVAPRLALDQLGHDADEVVCLQTPSNFHAVGQWYHDFRQTEDAEVIELLERARRELPNE